MNNNAKVFIIGSPTEHPYKYYHLGNSTKSISQMFNKDHPLLEELKKSKYPTICIGNDLQQRSDFNDLYKMLEKISIDNNVIRQDWNGFNIMLNESAMPGAFDIGIGALPESKKNNLYEFDLIWLVNCDKVDLSSVNKNSFIVYQGHHGDEGA